MSLPKFPRFAAGASQDSPCAAARVCHERGAGLSPCARNTIREAISRDTSSSQHVGHAVRRNRTRSAAGTFSGHRQGSRRHRRPVVWLTESLRRDERLVDETRERRPTREMSRKKEKPSLKRNFNPLYRIEQKPCSPPKVVHALLHAQEVLHVLSEVAENFEISSTLPHHRPLQGEPTSCCHAHQPCTAWLR